MTADVDRHCRECSTCQRSKLSAPTRAPMTNIPIGHPWQMIAVDILDGSATVLPLLNGGTGLLHQMAGSHSLTRSHSELDHK